MNEYTIKVLFSEGDTITYKTNAESMKEAQEKILEHCKKSYTILGFTWEIIESWITGYNI